MSHEEKRRERSVPAVCDPSRQQYGHDVRQNPRTGSRARQSSAIEHAQSVRETRPSNINKRAVENVGGGRISKSPLMAVNKLILNL